MRIKVERIAERIAAICSPWPCIEAIVLGELPEKDTFDPYFVLRFDAYLSGTLPAEEARRAAFGEAGAFESSRTGAKDRFLLEGYPVRIEYRLVADVEDLVSFGERGCRELLSMGTYPLRRIQDGRPLFDRSGWFEALRGRVAGVPASLWESLREVQGSRMEHCLADLGAAARMDDAFFFLESAFGFARNAAAMLFTINRSFEPAHRSIETALRGLAILPEDFFGRWEVFLRTDIQMSLEQKFEIANLTAKSILTLR